MVALGGGFVFRRQLVSNDNRDYQTQLSLDNQLTAQSSYVKAAQLWVDYAGRTSNSGHKVSAYVNAAIDLTNAHQYADAITMCKRAEKVNGVTFNEAGAAAEAYRDSGDKAQAIHYYRAAIKLAPARQSDHGAAVALYQQSLQNLESKP
jgi:tetratricopeptide (TPR) repeat protein